MRKAQLDPEIFYVQKIYFFLFIVTLFAITTTLVIWLSNWQFGLFYFGFGLLLSYLAMLLKKSFSPPPKTVIARRMAVEISQDTSSLTIARFASQLYFYFHEPASAISLLEKFLSSHDPLLCATLGDILLKEGKTKQAITILRSNPYALIDPLLLATQGHILQRTGKTLEAVKMYERSIHFAHKVGFPHSGAHWLTQKLLTSSYKANIHHALADCYRCLDNLPNARRHYWSGNLRLLDITLWRFSSQNFSNPAKNYIKL